MVKLNKNRFNDILVTLLFITNTIGISYTLATRFTSILFASRIDKLWIFIGCLTIGAMISALIYLVLFPSILRFSSFKQMSVVLLISMIIVGLFFNASYTPPPFPESHFFKITALGEQNPASVNSRVHIRSIQTITYPSLETKRIPVYELIHDGIWRRFSDSVYEVFVEDNTIASVELIRFMQAGIELQMLTGPESGLVKVDWDAEQFIIDLYDPIEGLKTLRLEPALNWRKADRIRKVLVGAAFLGDFYGVLCLLATAILSIVTIVSRRVRVNILGLRQFGISIFVIIAVFLVVQQVNTPVNFNNPKLEEGIRAALHQPQGDLYQRQLLALVELDLSGLELTRLDGIENLVNLASLNLRNNHLDDISLLAKLTKLESLDLRNNSIVDISPLANMVRLQYLNLHSNSAIRSIEPLASLTSLKKLILGNIPIGEQAQIIGSLTAIEYLNLRNCDLQDIDFLTPLTRLTHLNLYANPQIRSIKAISGLSQLETLILADLPLNEQAHQLSILQKLSYLNLRNTNLSDISFLADLKDLEYLNLHSNPRIQDIQALEQLTKLKHLILRNVPVNDQAEILASLTRLRSLNLRNTGITSLDFLSNLFAQGALQDNLKKKVSALVDIRDNQIPVGVSDSFASIRPYWENIAIREPLILPFYAALEKPVASHPSGFYENEISVSIAHPDKNVVLYYTLDGSEPDINSSIYSGAIELNASKYPPLSAASVESIAANFRSPDEKVQKAVILRLKAINPHSGQVSPVVSHSYFFWDGSSPRYTMPIISIVSDFSNFFDPDDGIYVLGNPYQAVAQDDISEDEKQLSANFNQRGENWEKPVHIEFFNIDGKPVFSQNGGIRIHGSGSRRNAQKSLRIYADCAYDVECLFNYPVFPSPINDINEIPDPQFEAFILRSFGQDWLIGMMRDALAVDILNDTGLDFHSQQSMIVFLNGEYWGVYQLQERYDEYYFRNHYGIESDELTVLRNNGQLNHGKQEDAQDFLKLISFVRNNDLAHQEIYEIVESQLDLNNFTDYLIANIFLGNEDWPNNNVFLWKYSTSQSKITPNSVFDGRWRWMIDDMDFILGLHGHGAGYEHNTLQSALMESHIGDLFRSLLNNDAYRIYFLNRFADHLNSTYLSDRIIDAIDRKQEELAPEMQEYFSRWGSNNENLLNDWYDEVDDMRTFALKRAEYITRHVVEHFALTDASNLLITLDPQQGAVFVNSIEISEIQNWEGVYFNGVPITITAIPSPGFQFSHWEGVDSQQSEIYLELTADTRISPVFIPDQSD
jgi:hypothetical protein